MIAKLGSAARASGSLPSGSDFKVWRALGAQMGLGRWGLACCGDKLERNAKRPPRRNRAGALLESLHHTSSDCRTQESELRASYAGLSALGRQHGIERIVRERRLASGGRLEPWTGDLWGASGPGLRPARRRTSGVQCAIPF